MTISLYVDEYVNFGTTYGLRIRGVDVLTVQEDGRLGGSDSILLDLVMELKRVIFTQDEDFLVEANRRQIQEINFLCVIYSKFTVITRGNGIHYLEIIPKASEPEDLINRVQYLPL